tara:strand:- start:122 stop:343 length:222 start_codon:yes stop_codon:yes gene_type:complete
MDIGVEHFSLTRYIPLTNANECSHAMVPASRAVASFVSKRDIHAAVTNTKKEFTHANDKFCWQDSWPYGGQWL